MPFTVPDFGLTCDVYTGPWATKVLRVSALPCNLAIGRRIQQQGNDYTGIIYGIGAASLLVPALSDVRDLSCGNQEDIIEVEPGSGRWYIVTYVEDMAKGYPNEYRFVGIQKLCQNASGGPAGLFWPTPIP